MYSLIKKKLRSILDIDKRDYPPDFRDKYLDTLELSYLFSIFNLYSKVKNLPGHIVEFGVGAGRNSILFGNMLKFTSQHSNFKYFGFDSFTSYTSKDLHDNSSLSKTKWKMNSLEFVENRINEHNLSGVCNFIQGDVRETIVSFLNTDTNRYSKDNFFAKLVYIDLSVYEPSKIVLNEIFKYIVPNGIIAIDQRKQGGEWRALIEYCQENDIIIQSSPNFNDVPAYIVKKNLKK